MRVRGCPKARGANKRDEAATRREREIKEKPSTQLAEKSRVVDMERRGKKKPWRENREKRRKINEIRGKDGRGGGKTGEFVCRLM